MRELGDDHAIIYVHVPKCGGTTLERIIEWEYRIFKVVTLDPTFFRWSYRRLLGWPRERLGRMKVFKGHMPFGLHKILPQPAAYMTVLREPIERAISEYYFPLSHPSHWLHEMMKQLTLEEFTRISPHANIQTKMIAGQDGGYDFLAGDCTSPTLEAAKENLSRDFALIGITERFNESLALAKIRLGWRVRRYADFNVTGRRPKKEIIPAAVRELIAERNSFDIELYRFATGLFDEMVARHADRIRDELKTIGAAREMSRAALLYYRGASIARKAVSHTHSVLEDSSALHEILRTAWIRSRSD